MGIGRPAPVIIDSFDTDKVSVELVESECLWAVLRDGKHVILRRSYPDKPNRFYYPKSFFPSKGQALVLSRKLSMLFPGNTFTAVNIAEIINNVND